MFRSLGARPFVLPAPVFLVGTYDADARPNIMAAAWGGICASQPPCVAVSVTKARWTYTALMARKAFTVSIPSSVMAAQADFAGITSGRTEDKFAALGLTPQPGEHVDAPFVAECPVVIELRLVHTLELGSHVQFVGEIMDVKVQDDCLNAEGHPDMLKVDPLLYAPLAREYWAVGRMVARAFSVGRSADRRAVVSTGS